MRAKRHTYHQTHRHKSPRRQYPAGGDKVYVYGKHALMEALANAPHIVRKVFFSPDIRDAQMRALVEKHQIPFAPLAQGRGNDLVGKDTAHQGVIFTITTSSLLTPLDAFLTKLDTQTNPAVAVLGEVQDPHNVGAIIRSAAAFGLSGVLIPEHNQAGITGAVVKASAGMVFRVPLVTIGNVNVALKILKNRGFWIYGLSTNGTSALGTEPFDAPSAFIVGNEGSGIREKTLAACDVSLSIPMHNRTESLNAAVSAAIVFYEWSRKHPEAL